MNLNELLGVEFPFIQGGMANIATGAFAAAVSNAGALGLVGGGGLDAGAGGLCLPRLCRREGAGKREAGAGDRRCRRA